MELNTANLCNGCLSQDRKITNISDITSEQCLLLIINESKMFPNAVKNIYLCWECKAKLRNFIIFKEQVKRSFDLLQDHTKLNTPLTSLSTKTIFQIDLSITINESTDNIIIKTENNTYYNTDNCDYTSDDVSLINYSKDKDKRHKKKRLKKKQKVSTLKNRNELINRCNSKEKDKSVINYEKKDIVTDHVEIKDNLTDGVEEKDKLNENFDQKETVLSSNNEEKDILINHVEQKDMLTEHVEIKDNLTEQVEDEMFKIVELKSEEVFEERRRLEKSQDYVNAMFRCDRCIISFPNEDDLKDHVRKKHELHASKHKCNICECSFSSEVSLNYHKNTHIKRYECKICKERTQNKRAAMKHYELTHCYSETYELETKDDHNSNDKSKTEISGNNGIKEDGYCCEFCDKVFRWKTSLRKHLEMHQIEAGQKRRPYCEPCGLTFTTTSNLQRHAKTSSKHQIKLKLRKLKETNQASGEDKQKELNDIKVSVLSTKELYSCPQCEKKFEWRGNMLRHLHTHVARAKGELVCKPCNRTFSSKATYNQHLQISKKHVSENDFKHMCSDCGKRYPNKWKLKEHVNWEHLKNYVHSCNDCQKVFKCNTSLYLHRQMAHKANESLCDLCGKSFSNKTKLQSHISALHSTEAPYKCKSCSARFTWQSCLSRHVRRLHNNTN